MESIALEHLKKVDCRLAKVIEHFGSLPISSYNTAVDSFEFLVREIIGQMISSKVKHVILNRLYSLCNYEITPSKICNLSHNQLRSIGLSNSKAEYISNLASICNSGNLDFSEFEFLDDDEICRRLIKIKGIGKWTSKMYLLFYLKRPDILPFDDVAFQQAFKWLYSTVDISKNNIIMTCSSWSPYSSYASRYLYHSLDMGLTKIPIQEFLNKNFHDYNM